MVTVLMNSCPPVNSISLDDIETTTKGLEAGKSIAEVLEKIEFADVLRKIGKNVGPYLGAIGPFIGFVSAFFQTESAELSYLKEMMKYIDKRFDQMDKRFDTIEKMIKWNVVQVNFGQIEQRIQATAREYRYLYIVPLAAVENRKKIFIKNYESDYQNSGTKLYQSIVNKQGMFQEDLGTSVMRYTDRDRRKTQLFLLGVMQLILQATKIELAYLFSYKYDHNANFMKSQWINRTENVRTKFKDIDDQCIRAYFDKSKRDIDEYSAKNYGKPHKQFATELYNLLAEKYYWRDWIVVSYNPISGHDKHMLRVTGGLTLLRKHGRNLLVTSVDKNHPVMNLSRAKQEINAKKYKRRKPKDVFFYVDHSGASKGASLVSVTKMFGTGLAFKCNTKRLVLGIPGNWIILWG
ncbi:Hypothetical predicted protein [Mytilus galloprovincialis]|uniref:Uncharacterized protein n=1 Tax=Mytilus galloprovincialis TaxID=29158 RepID=A0A8B6BVT8_MYTGA|nr:Hypothetical predicted protein [Mytilus galloprovincialis]